MKKFNEYSLEILFVIFLSVVLGAVLPEFTLGDDPAPSTEKRLPVEDNFNSEKLWTDADFKQAEVDLLDVDYTTQLKHLPPPDYVTEEDVALIQRHQKEQLKRMIAGQ